MFRIATLPASLLLIALSAGAVSAQGAASPPASAPKVIAAGTPAIRAGTYDLEVAFGGGVMQGTLQLIPVGDSLAAKMHVGEHDPQVRSMTRKGAQLTLAMDMGGEGMTLIYDFKFDGDALTGSFKYNGDPGLVTGKRRK
jgi:hypothetical protein